MVMDWLKKLGRSNTAPAGDVDRRPAPVAAKVSGPEPAIPLEQIARRAYEKWVARGRPAGTSTQDWLEAEAELRAECRKFPT
jgi:hypothetical protein